MTLPPVRLEGARLTANDGKGLMVRDRLSSAPRV
jgi:hypothetical protein